jgi:hypothetical protein
MNASRFFPRQLFDTGKRAALRLRLPTTRIDLHTLGLDAVLERGLRNSPGTASIGGFKNLVVLPAARTNKTVLGTLKINSVESRSDR